MLYPGFALIDAYDIFLLDRQAQNLSTRSVDTYRYRIGKFIRWCAEQEVTSADELNAAHIRRYQTLLVRTCKDVTAKNHMVDVKTFLKFCIDEGFISESPAQRVKLPKVVNRLPIVLTSEQVNRLYKACATGRDRALLLVMLDTGARLEEVTNMQVTDVDFDQGMITIREGKPRRDRECYISPRTHKELLKYMRARKVTQGALWRSERGNRPLTTWGISQIIERIRNRAGVPECRPHVLRKTFVTTMLRSGVDVFTLQKLSGHTSINSLKPYVAVSKVDAHEAHKRASPVATLLTE